MRGKIAKLIRKEVYGDDSPRGVEKVLRHRKTGQIIKDEKRRHYQKTKKNYHKVKIYLHQKESTKTLEIAKESIKRRERNRKRFLARKAISEMKGVE